MSIAGRQVAQELMDDPSLDPQAHRAALRGLANINSVTGSAAVMWRAIRMIAVAAEGRPLRVLDVACGGGDVTVAVRQSADREGLPIHIDGCDISATAVDHARYCADRARVSVSFYQLDVLGGPLPSGYDVLMSSLFFHHLRGHDAQRLLRAMSLAAPHVVVSDLERGRLGYWAAWLGTRLLSRSPVVRFDGPVSVLSAFSKREFEQLAADAGLSNARITRWWPFRLLLEWSRH